jgi:methylenetetrahydrofolate dehydrogenase (NADP+)/methenyltetrahydrofolate cyclohydrolase
VFRCSPSRGVFTGGVKVTAELISGKEVSKEIYGEMEGDIAAFIEKHGFPPHLTVILVGEDPASQVYVRMKGKKAKKLGIGEETIRLPVETPEDELLGIIDKLNADDKVNGILVQLPLPKHINETNVLLRIDPAKDVDGFHPINVGKMLVGEDNLLLPCTPHGVQELLARSGTETEGAHVVVVGRSNIVGKPVAAILVQKKPGANATVTVCHTRTKDMGAVTRTGDILVVAAGVPEFVTGDMVKPGAVVIDVGVNRVDDPESEKGYKLVGDVNFAEASEVASKITPVPGGVGPMTICMLMKNTLQAAKNQVGDA